MRILAALAVLTTVLSSTTGFAKSAVVARGCKSPPCKIKIVKPVVPPQRTNDLVAEPSELAAQAATPPTPVQPTAQQPKR